MTCNKRGLCCESPLTATPWPATHLFLFGQEAVNGRLKRRIGLGAFELPEGLDLRVVRL